MAGAQTELEEYLAGEIRKYKGVSVPLRAGMLERMTKKKLSCDRLHPNPADEFCHPEVGPSFRIIGEYEKKIRKAMLYDLDPFEEPVMVEKMHPDGYLILNGHHRWAAAMRCGAKKIPVKIVNLTQDTDIEKILKNSMHDRRVSLDLDEVVFGSAEDVHLEKPLRFPKRHFYRERLVLGIPALFHYLSVHGYDIWVYTASYYSYDYLRHLFRLYHAHVDGVITGTKRKVEDTQENRKREERIKNLFSSSYRQNITIDRTMVLRTSPGQREYEEFPLSGENSDWSAEVLSVLEGFEKETVHE